MENVKISGNEGGIIASGTVNVTGYSTVDDDIVLITNDASFNVNDTENTKISGNVMGLSGAQLGINNSTSLTIPATKTSELK